MATPDANSSSQPDRRARRRHGGLLRAALRLASATAWSFCAAAACVAAPAPHAVPDTIAQRLQACTACHGKEGVATNEGYFPRIAGKPAGYLYNQLMNFRDGRRRNGTMSYLVENMSEAYLTEIAAYFASLDLPYPPPPAGTARVPELARGQTLVREGDVAAGLPACVQCHGQAMTGVAPAMPGLLGVPRDYLLAQLGAWRVGQRHAAPPDCMKEISQRLSPNDLSAVASYLSLQHVPADAKPATGIALPLPLACGSGPR